MCGNICVCYKMDYYIGGFYVRENRTTKFN